MTSVAGVALLATFSLASTCGLGQKTKTPPAAPATGLEILWQHDIVKPDDALSPWVAAGESTVFLAGPKIGLTAHAAADGSIAWTSSLASTLPPIIAGAHVLIASEHEVILLKQDQDAVVWRAEIEAPASATFAFGERIGAVVGNDVVAWDAGGSRVWRAALPDAPSTPVVFSKDTLFVGLGNATLVALDAASGKERWHVQLPAKPESLAAADDQLFLSTVEAHLYRYPTTGAAKHDWDFRKIRTIGQPMADDRLVYFTLLDNAVHAFERNGGSERWNTALADRPMQGPLRLSVGLAVALRTGGVVQLTPKGRIVPPAVPANIPSETSLQWAVTSPGGTRVFTVTTARDQKRLLTAWGPPASGVSGK